jgi:hypothetical protein
LIPDATVTKCGREGGIMGQHSTIVKIACVGLVATVMFPVGRVLFPYVAPEIGGTTFGALEAMASASLGFSIYAVLFG